MAGQETGGIFELILLWPLGGFVRGKVSGCRIRRLQLRLTFFLRLNSADFRLFWAKKAALLLEKKNIKKTLAVSKSLLYSELRSLQRFRESLISCLMYNYNRNTPYGTR